MKTTAGLALGIALGAPWLPGAAAADAKSNWDEHCAKCHGASGKADTKLGIKIKLRDYSDAKVQASLTDEVLLNATLTGVTVDGKERMKAFSGKVERG
jgi:cytochrome c553